MNHISSAAVAAAVYLVVAATAVAQSEVDRKIEELQRQYRSEMDAMQAGYESRIAALEGEVIELRGQVDDTIDSPLTQSINTLVEGLNRRGIADMSQTTLFDNTFNPAVTVLGDFVLTASNQDDSVETQNQFILRDVEVGIYGRVDPHLAYFVFVHFDEEEIELEEAYGLVDDWLPDTFWLKFGRYNLDFGKLVPIHDHDLPFVDKPGVIQDYLGGSLRGTGVELHHWLPIGDFHLFRWTVGIVNQLDGDTHAVTGPLAGEDHDHDEEGAEPFGERSFDDFAFHARISALFEIGQESTLQIGASGAWAPEARSFVEVEAPGAVPFGVEPDDHEVVAVDLERAIVGVDVTYKWLDPATGEGLTIGAEGFMSYSRFLPEDDEDHDHAVGIGAAGPGTEENTAFGFYAYTEYFFNPRWSLGVSGEWFERAQEAGETWWDVGSFLTWRVDEFNRIRLEARYFEDSVIQEEYFVVMAQWTVILGSHGHGIDW